MTDIILGATEFGTAAIVLNGVLLLAMGLAMMFAKQIDGFAARWQQNGPDRSVSGEGYR